MQWLNEVIAKLLRLTSLDLESKIGGSIQFFVYDTIKIMELLAFLIFIISYIQSYFPPEKTKKILCRFHGVGAALLGTVTPFCSCSSIPIFIGFTSAGLPFGWKVAVLYVVLGLVIAVAGGTLIEKLHLENQVEEFIRNANALDTPQNELYFKDRANFAWE